MKLGFRQAQTSDEPTVADLQAEAIAWLASKGTDQWQTTAPHNPWASTDRSLSSSIAQGKVFLALDGETAVGSLTLDDFADPEFWTETDDPASALYVHRMVIVRRLAGQGLGGQMLDWAVRETADQGHRWLRLDAWKTNTALHAYYRSQGFELVRVVDLPHRGSGALFQKDVRVAMPA
ncbi:GNAT family N-acetyltransferase [Kineosporia sp. NBRC 101731]|uniref:GNAT family N-acetyltransferase n=1 Tax=Kineosporia sp. NBRC 101731 TaxID=3032199 RepID=UPI0024A365E4|nr:GNAT family N-acetyltransferase [Kineosporia sp. NBRC 101731]GLY26821.1 putative N-acetyltransferase YesJ [Kineosporia sp. NBRC 101731]